MYPANLRSSLPGYDQSHRDNDDLARHQGDYPPSYYPPALPTPHYTPDPRPCEARIHLSTGASFHQSRAEDLSHVIYEKTKHFSVTFMNQPPNCTRPTYGRGTAIQGLLTIFKPEDVASVVLKFEGKMFYSIDTETNTGENDNTLFEQNLKLFPQSDTTVGQASTSTAATRRQSNFFFARGSTSVQQSNEVCPQELSFSLRIPFSYPHDQTSYFPPPTYSIVARHRNAAAVKVQYELKVIITRRAPLVDRKSSVSFPIIYLPRSRPTKPMTDNSPEDWRVFTAQSGVRKGFSSNIDVVQAFLAIPCCQIYPINTRIRFYLELWSLSPSTLAMYTQVPPALGHSKGQSSSSSNNSSETARVDVVVLRNLKVEMLQRTLKFSQTLATANMRLHETGLRPTVRTAIDRVQATGKTAFSKRNGNACMCWEGEIMVSGDEPLWGGCSGFLAPNVFVRDLIALRIVPPKYKDYPLNRIELYIPIRLTTDPYGDELIHGMEIIRSPT